MLLVLMGLWQARSCSRRGISMFIRGLSRLGADRKRSVASAVVCAIGWPSLCIRPLFPKPSLL